MERFKISFDITVEDRDEFIAGAKKAAVAAGYGDKYIKTLPDAVRALFNPPETDGWILNHESVTRVPGSEPYITRPILYKQQPAKRQPAH